MLLTQLNPQASRRLHVPSQADAVGTTRGQSHALGKRQFALDARLSRSRNQRLGAAFGTADPAHLARQPTLRGLCAVVRRQPPHTQPKDPLAWRLQQVNTALPMFEALVKILIRSAQAIRHKGATHQNAQRFSHQRNRQERHGTPVPYRTIGRNQSVSVCQRDQRNQGERHRQINAARIRHEHRIDRQQHQRPRRTPAPAMPRGPCRPPCER